MADHNVRVNVNTSADTSAVDKLEKSLASVQQQIEVLISHSGMLKSNNELLAQSWAELDTKTKAFQSDLANLQKGTQEYEVKNNALNETIKLQNETYSELRKNRTEIASNERMITALQKKSILTKIFQMKLVRKIHLLNDEVLQGKHILNELRNGLKNHTKQEKHL